MRQPVEACVEMEISSCPDHRHKNNGKLDIKDAQNSYFMERQKTSVKCTCSLLRVDVVLDATTQAKKWSNSELM